MKNQIMASVICLLFIGSFLTCYAMATQEPSLRTQYTAGNVIARWHMDEGSGSSITDSSGYGRTGEIMIGDSVGDGIWGVGKYGSALYFNGSIYVDIVVMSGMPQNTSTPFSISLWFKPDVINGYVDLLYWGNNPQTNGIVGLMYSDLGWNLNFIFYGNDLSYTGAIQVGSWNHLVATYDGSRRAIYLNGVLAANDTTTALSITTMDDFWLGYRESYYKGSLDEVIIFNKALTESEIQGLYAGEQNGISGFQLPFLMITVLFAVVIFYRKRQSFRLKST
jgi:Concanavalin A-like lectin/glucanases superfamily